MAKYNWIYAAIMALLRAGTLGGSGAILATQLPPELPAFVDGLAVFAPFVISFLMESAFYKFGNPFKGIKGGSQITPMILMLLVCAGLAGGCAHSKIHLNEELGDGSKTRLTISDTSTIAKQSTLQNFSYSGEGENPWRLSAGQDVQHDSTQVLSLLKELLNVAAQIAPMYAPPKPAPAPEPATELPPLAPR